MGKQMQEAPKVLYIGTPSDKKVEAGHLAKSAGIARYAEARGWRVIPVAWSRGLRRNMPALIRNERPAGCIVECSAALGAWLPPPLFAGTPTVWLDCREGVFGPGVPTVVCDQGAVVRQAFHELQSLRPAALGVVSYLDARFWSKPRADAFQSLAAEAGLPCHPFMYRIHPAPADSARLRKWLVSLPRRTALFCVNDNLAAAVVAAAAAAGLSVPRDIMVLGVDNRDASLQDAPLGISSVHVDFERGGYIAARALDALMHGSPIDSRDTTFGPYMTVRRRSTGGARRAEPNITEAMRIIRSEACQGLRAEDVVRRIPGSRSLVDLRFREATGHSILDEILHVRLEKACLLLAGTRTSIDAVATFCGFGSENSLLKVFRARFGISMRQWRKLHALPARRT